MSKKFGLRRALSTKPVPRQQDPVFIQEDVDEHGQVIVTRQKPARSGSLLGRIFRKKSRTSEDLHTIHSGDPLVIHTDPMRPAPSVAHSDYEGQPHSFAGAGTHLMTEPVHHEHIVREHSLRDHSVRDHQSVRDHSVHGGYRDDRSRGYPDYASTAGHTRDVYERDFGREDPYPHEHVTVVHDSPRQSPISAPRDYHHVPRSTAGGTVIHEIHDGRSVDGRSARSLRSSAPAKHEVEVNLMPGEKQEFEIGPNTQLIVPDDVELEISDGKGGWLPYHESLLRRPPREEVYVISGGSNFIVEDEMGNVLHRSQPSHYPPVSVAGSVAGRSTRSRREEGTVYLDDARSRRDGGSVYLDDARSRRGDGTVYLDDAPSRRGEGTVYTDG